MFDGKTYEPSDGPRLRDLRKPRYGSHPVERRRVSAGVFQYRVCA